MVLFCLLLHGKCQFSYKVAGGADRLPELEMEIPTRQPSRTTSKRVKVGDVEVSSWHSDEEKQEVCVRFSFLEISEESWNPRQPRLAGWKWYKLLDQSLEKGKLHGECMTYSQRRPTTESEIFSSAFFKLHKLLEEHCYCWLEQASVIHQEIGWSKLYVLYTHEIRTELLNKEDARKG